MDNPFEEIRAAIDQMRELNFAADSYVNVMLDLIDGRLRRADPHRVKRLKSALRKFNARTGRWAP